VYVREMRILVTMSCSVYLREAVLRAG